MSLFPAYASDGDGAKAHEESDQNNRWNVPLEQAEAAEELHTAGDKAALELETALLASDSSEDAPATPPPVVRTSPPDDVDFYLDGKADHGNLGVITLYYPGRPMYKRATKHALGVAAVCGGGTRARRYYLQPAAPPPASRALEVAERAQAYRHMLADCCQDEELWLRFIDFQEEWGDGAAWLAACEQAAARVVGGARVRTALHRARAAANTPQDLLKAITSDLHEEKCPSLRLEHWLRLLWTLGGAGGAGGVGTGGLAGAGGAAGEVQRAALAALQEMTHEPRAYPHILYAYGATLRAAGLWEQLVLLLELVCAVNYPPSGAFPPPAPPAELAQEKEQRLLDAEDAVIGSGLPLSTVWVRVERLRGAAHWRPPPGGQAGAGDADPQRVPAAADVAPLLLAVRPAATLLMCVSMLRLAQVPLLPMSEAVRRACSGGDVEDPDVLCAVLPAISRAARRLPAAHAAHAAHACSQHVAALRRSLAQLLDPPHYFTDDAGYLTWVSALWEACCGWLAGRRRLALVCWWLRWLHALARLAEPAEARRLRAQARRVLKLHAAAEPLAFALFARIEADVGDPEEARRVALQAVRASAGNADVPREHALFAARVLRELLGGREPALAAWALCGAARTRPLPSDVNAPPAEDELHATLLECSARCTELERGFEAGPRASVDAEPDADATRALSCGAGEWAAARLALQAPAARDLEWRRLLTLDYSTVVHKTAESTQYYEAGASAAALWRGSLALLLQPLFLNNAMLALACAGAPLWAARRPPAPRTHVHALALVLPALLGAPLDDSAHPTDMARLARTLTRAASRGAGGAALGKLRLEAEARMQRPSLHRVLLAALADYPNDKWLYVRGAAWVCAEAEALCDAALERGLRAHALTHELRPLPAPAPPPAPPSGETK